MELIPRDDYDHFLAAHKIRLGINGIPAYHPDVASHHHMWHYPSWDTKLQPKFISLLIEAFDPWEWCLLAKRVERNPTGWNYNEQTPYFRKFINNYDCPVMGTYCLVNPQSIEEGDEVDDCMFFDAFCIDQWARCDNVRSLEIPEDFIGALRLQFSEVKLLTDIVLMTLYFGGPWDDLLILPSHGRQVCMVDHDEIVITLFCDDAWRERVDAIVALGFTDPGIKN